jgi:hypothetical protein
MARTIHHGTIHGARATSSGMKELSKSLARVFLQSMHADSEPLFGHLNPTTLRYSRGVNIGELEPVGGSHSVLMYGNTRSAEVPLEFYFSTQLNARAGAGQYAANLAFYVDWFDAFCFPLESGAAPPPLLLVWPRVMETVLVITDFDAEYVRFYSEDLAPQAVRVTVSARELRQTPRTYLEHRRHGMRRLDPIHAEWWQKQGSPLNFKRGR